ncbi:MAG TPA: fused MFS/spermidine synthase [Polyangia bacterium]
MLLPLYAITLFLASGLLFAVEPLVAKGLLPLLGGGAAVWTTAVAFFQVALVGGYLYAHLLAVRVGTRRSVWLHVALLAGALALFPLARPEGWVAPPAHQALWLFGRLAVTVGPPFVLLAATAPLLQSWFAGTAHRGARDPYFLYAASNAGSMAALLVYPVAVEPFVGLTRQRHLWNAGLVVALGLLGACALAAVRLARCAGEPAPSPVPPPGARSASPGWRQRARWLALAAVPSSLLLSVTSYVTTDLVAVPLLWLVPLALYLATFIAAFSPRQPFSPRRMLWLQPLLLVPLAAEMFVSTVGSAPLLIPIHLGIFFVTALCCHQMLAQSRPEADRSTEFYLWIAVGGALGGLFNVFAAPLLFRSVAEYPLGFVAAALLRPAPVSISDEARARRRDLTLPLALAAILGGGVWVLQRTAAGMSDLGGRIALAVVLSAAGCATYAFRGRPRRFGLGLLAMIASGALYAQGATGVVFRARSFYAVHKVVRTGSSKLELTNGNTVHGVQDLRSPTSRRTPLSYYSRGGPIGDVIRLRAEQADRRPAGVVGLGVGTLAAYAEPGERWTFFEIDPAIVHIAREGGLFTYLADARGEVSIVLGDGRLSLAVVPDGTFGLLVLDAFSSDAVPAHLLTREALALYVRKLAPGGLVAFHLSNRYLALVDVVSGSVAAAGLVGLTRTADVTAAEARAGISPSTWVVLARAARDLGPLATDPRWRPLPAGTRGWSDDASSLWSALSLR